METLDGILKSILKNQHSAACWNMYFFDTRAL